VEAVVRGRVDHLPAEEREVLSLAAVIGPQFGVLLLEQIVADRNELSRILGHLEDARMIRRIGGVGNYTFSHIVVQEVVYASLLKRRRSELHAEVAQHIEATYEGDRLAEHFETLARHFGASKMLDQASHYSELAGDKASLAYSLEQASDHYRRAVEHLDAMPVNDEQQWRRVDMSLKWGRASIWRPSPEQLDVLRQSVDVAREIGHDRAVVRALYWMGWQQYTLGDQVSAIELLEQCVEEASAQNDVRLEAQAHANLGYCHAAGRNLEQALRRLQRAADLQQQSSRRFWGDGYSLAYQGLIHGDLGAFEQAYEFLDAAEAEALEQNDLPLLGSILTQLGIVESWQGEWAKSLATGRRLEIVSRRVQGFYMMEMSKTVQGYASSYLAADLGEDPASMALMETAIERLEELSLRLSMSWNAACFAEALAIRGHSERAIRVARRSLDRLGVGDRMGDAMAHRALAIASIRRPRPDPDAATEHLSRADQAANRAGVEREKAITDYWRAELWRDLGDTLGARAACEPALPVFERMGMAWHLDRTTALLKSL
jgi:tetratricopeptide (TPR) repeat protein